MPPETPCAGVIEGREHRLAVRVYYEDTDFTGVVYHANYLRFFERGRSDFLRLAGVDHASLLALPKPMAFAVAKMSIDFVRPARIDDALAVTTAFETLKGARLLILQRIDRAGERVAAAEVEVACIEARGRPRRLPAHLAARLQPFLGEGG